METFREPNPESTHIEKYPIINFARITLLGPLLFLREKFLTYPHNTAFPFITGIISILETPGYIQEGVRHGHVRVLEQERVSKLTIARTRIYMLPEPPKFLTPFAPILPRPMNLRMELPELLELSLPHDGREPTLKLTMWLEVPKYPLIAATTPEGVPKGTLLEERMLAKEHPLIRIKVSGRFTPSEEKEEIGRWFLQCFLTRHGTHLSTTCLGDVILTSS